ncbi:MAG: energy transducer TonB [Xanthomonadaceae bacterium]|nr:energy transducer TonB [Xanthomonadaceae bacterium]
MEYAADRNTTMDPSRVAGISLALVLNIAAMMLLLRGIDPGLIDRPVERTQPPTIWVEPPAKPIPLPVPPPAQVVQQKAKANPLPPPPVPPVEVAGPIDFIAPPPAVSLSQPAATAQSNAVSEGTGGASGNSLRYEHAPPPPYPRLALQRGWQGTVWLLVSVDPQGRPVAVDIHQGSGYALLDRSARQQVLKRWRFVPAMRAGQAVAAQGLVPIDFTID